MRIRTIKPEFWLHENLASLTPLHRLLFIGLWQLADKEGRLEYRPVRIRAALFPYEPVEIDVLVKGLTDAGVVQVYGEEGSLLAIPGFKEHQRPHPKEPASTLPEPPSREKKRRAVERFSGIPSSPVGREGKGMDKGKGREPVAPELPAPPPAPHQETVDRLFATYKAAKAATYMPVGRAADFKAVKEMLAAGATPDEIDTAWSRALVHVGFPNVSSFVELQQHFNRFTGTGPPRKAGIGPVDPSTQNHTRTGYVENFGEQP